MDEPAQASSRMKVVLALGLIFTLGLVCGAALFFLGQRSIDRPRGPEHPPGHPMERLNRTLGLDEEQHAEVRAILDEQRVRLDAVLEDSRQRIREVLSPEQQEIFDEIRPQRPGPPEGHRPPHGHLPPPGHRPPPPPPQR